MCKSRIGSYKAPVLIESEDLDRGYIPDTHMYFKTVQIDQSSSNKSRTRHVEDSELLPDMVDSELTDLRMTLLGSKKTTKHANILRTNQNEGKKRVL